MSPTLILVLAVLGTVAICLGSQVVVAAPGDGQTCVVTIPLWFLGGVSGAVSLTGLLISKPDGYVGAWVAGLAAISVGSVVRCYVVCAKLERDWKRSRPEAGSREE